MTATGKQRMRYAIITVSRAAKGSNSEEVESWPGDGTAYYAAIESFAANEVIAQGQNHSTGSKRLRIRGRAIAVTAADHVRDVVTLEEFAVTGVAREQYDTIIDIARVVTQSVAQ